MHYRYISRFIACKLLLTRYFKYYYQDWLSISIKYVLYLTDQVSHGKYN